MLGDWKSWVALTATLGLLACGGEESATPSQGSDTAPADVGDARGDARDTALDTTGDLDSPDLESTDSSDDPQPDTGTDLASPDVPGPREHLVLLDDGILYPTGATIDLGSARAGVPPRTFELVLSNPNDHPIALSGSPDEWLVSEPVGALMWDEAPPVELAAGQTVGISVLLGGSAATAVQASLALAWPTGSFEVSLEASISDPPRFVAIGDAGRVTSSVDFGATWPDDLWEGEGGHTELTLRGVVWAQGRFVSVGGAQTGTYRISEDGVNWRRDFEGTRSWVGSVAYGGGRFVTAGAFGNLSWSEDGLSWTETHQDFDPHLRSIAYGNGRFVAVGGERRAVTLDGSEWISDLRGMPGVNYVAFAHGVFVAVGPDGVMASSDDGVEWDDVVRGTAGRRVVAGGGVFVAGGWPDPTLTSTDGVAWVEREDPAYVRPAGYAHGWFIGFSWRDRLWRSRDGWQWELVKDNVEESPGGFSSLAAQGP